MSIHLSNENKLSDTNFEKGSLYHIVPGNKGRVLDGRRTPGFIEKYDYESAMFIWRITDFEDNGKCWEIPAEEIVAYQFEKNSLKLSKDDVKDIEAKCELFSEKLVIYGSEAAYERTLDLIEKEKLKTKHWFINQSEFARLGNCKLDIQSKEGSTLLYNDLKNYMEMSKVYELETKTANQFLLNPYSGEWIKGLRIVMAEMGLIDFNEKRTRTNNIFEGIGSKEHRKSYIISRMAFIQTFFELANYEKVQLFRGMSTEGNLIEKPKTLISASFNPEVGKAFSDISFNEQVSYSYLIKLTYPIKNLFMTFFETKSFNERYKEQEAVILYRDKFTF